MRERIEHKGRIISVTPEYTSVEIVSESACSACHAKGLCGLSESKSKAVQVPTRVGQDFHIGDEVTVELAASMGHKAVWIAYVIPLGVLLFSLLGLISLGVRDVFAAVSAFAAIAVYYFLVWLFRDRLRDEYMFNIKFQ